MDNLIYIVFACVAIPLIWSLILLEKKSRIIVAYIVIGGFMCVFISEINTIVLNATGSDMYFATTNIAPINEEIIKALPVLFFAFLFSDDRTTLLSLSMAVGIGFAIVENAYIFVQSGMSYTLLWAIGRVVGASLMHAICTASVGYGISFVKKKKKLFYTGTFALLLVAITYHSVFNSIIQSDLSDFGLLLPIITYIPLIIWLKKGRENKKSKA